MNLPADEQQKQALYRDARFTENYDGIWQNVGKCVFCDLRDKYVIHEENGIVLTIILYAYIDGHMLIVPRRHVESPKEFTPGEWEAVRKLMYISKKIIKKAHGISGVQFIQKDGIMAQSTVGHIHYHAVPFDSPDLNTWHYRKLANTPAENASLYKNLAEDIQKLSTKYDQKYSEGSAKSAASFDFDWNDIAFGSKKVINQLNATFIAAPREISVARFTQLVKANLPSGNILLGLAKESFIDGFEDQPQFRTLQKDTIQKIIDAVNAKSPKNKIYTLSYFQRETKFIFEKLDFKKVLLIRGSWHKTFHTRAEYYALVNHGTPYQMISPFTDEKEAREFEARINPELPKPETKKLLTETEMMESARIASVSSFDYSFQTGVALGKKAKSGYKLLATSFNKVVPFQTYAMHNGATREINFTPPNDLNYYDTVHAEVEMILKVGKEKLDLAGTTLFINLMPCPSCTRMFCDSDIPEFVYQFDHSNSYAIEMLQKAGKKIRRIE